MCFAPYTARISTPIMLLKNLRSSSPGLDYQISASTICVYSAATLLLSLGIHPKVVQELLGHTQISMTMDVYSHVLPGMQQDAMRQLDAALIKEERLENENASSRFFPGLRRFKIGMR
jgi:hypothetical protein